LVVEYELPLISAIIPDVDQYRYVKASDQITNKKRAEKTRAAEYLSAIAQVTLRTIYEVFASKQLTSVTSVVFNGFVNTIDAGTGHPIAPHLISVRTTREEFSSLDLRNVEPTACLKRLSATVSPKPSELQPVRPIIDFNMVDPRFVQEQDVLGALDQRQNLMELTPGQFESLITNLFQKMGL
jgi:restriction system protein